MVDYDFLEEVVADSKDSMRFILKSVSDSIWKQYHYSEQTVNPTEDSVDITFTICDDTNKKVLNYVLRYNISDDWTRFDADFDESACVNEIKDYLSSNNINASQSLEGKKKIMAAFEDFGDSLFEDDDMVDERDYDYENEDEVDQDTESIEIENNIENHYIMECSRCHGIFISALVESDQEVDSIRGICPLCNHESDQIAKWIVRTV